MAPRAIAITNICSARCGLHGSLLWPITGHSYLRSRTKGETSRRELMNGLARVDSSLIICAISNFEVVDVVRYSTRNPVKLKKEMLVSVAFY